MLLKAQSLHGFSISSTDCTTNALKKMWLVSNQNYFTVFDRKIAILLNNLFPITINEGAKVYKIVDHVRLLPRYMVKINYVLVSWNSL